VYEDAVVAVCMSVDLWISYIDWSIDELKLNTEETRGLVRRTGSLGECLLRILQGMV